MQRLNIPLRSNQTTRRKPRRVVLGFLSLFLIVFAVTAIVRIALNRTTFQIDSDIEFVSINLIGNSVLANLSEQFAYVPLLKNRSLTYLDVMPFVEKELAVAIFPASGERAVMFRGSVPEDVRSVWKAYGIDTEQFGDGRQQITLLVSENNSGTVSIKNDRKFLLRSAFPGFAGSLRLDNNKTEFITMNSNQLFFHSRIDIPKTDIPSSLGEFAFWFPFNSEMSSVEQIFKHLQLSTGLSRVLDLVSGADGTVYGRSDSMGFGVRIELIKDVESQKLAEILQFSAMIQSPVTTVYTLPDETIIEEMRLNPVLVNMQVEERENGTLVTAKKDDIYLLAEKRDGRVVLTNREDLLELEGSGNDPVAFSCGFERGALINIKEFQKLTFLGLTSYHSDLYVLDFFELLQIHDRGVQICW